MATHESQFKLPIDLRIFATLAGLWSLCLAATAIVHGADAGGDGLVGIDPLRAIFAGVRFGGDDARLVLIVEAAILAAISMGILGRRRWGLLLALFFMAEIVMSHLAYAVAYTVFQTQWMTEWWTVRRVALQGPTLVMITLYLWIRSTDLIFDAPRAAAENSAVSQQARSQASSQAASQMSAPVEPQVNSEPTVSASSQRVSA